MHRIDDPSAVTSIPTPLQPGTPGYFTDGSPTIGEDATIVRADWTNAVQEEISYVIESAGLTLSKTDRTQLLQAIARLTRLRLTAPITFYVSPGGNDSSDGLTPGTAWASITHAYNYIRDRIDLNGFQATVQLADGTYASAACQFPCVGPAIILAGDPNDNTKVVVNGVGVPAISATMGAALIVQNLTVTASGAQGDYQNIGAGLFASSTGGIIFSNVNFGPCTYGQITVFGGGEITTGRSGVVYTISGGAPAHILNAGGGVTVADSAITINNAPTFSQGGFAQVSNAGLIQIWGCTFTGTAHGQRYYVWGNGVMETGEAGPNYLPGDVAGVVSTGGQYM